jgi:short chain dehydrogenase
MAMAQAGADVAAPARAKSDLEQVEAAVEQAGRRALVPVADLTRSASLARTVTRVLDAFGHIDMLVNTGAGFRPWTRWFVGAGECGQQCRLHDRCSLGGRKVLGVDLFGGGVQQAVGDGDQPVAGHVGAEGALVLAAGDEALDAGQHLGVALAEADGTQVTGGGDHQAPVAVENFP